MTSTSPNPAPVTEHRHQQPLILGRDYDIRTASDGRRVWVDGPDGSCIGRFDMTFGIDVHATATDHIASGVHCLYCTHEAAGYAEWVTFCAKMLEHHGVPVPLETLEFQCENEAISDEVEPEASAAEKMSG